MRKVIAMLFVGLCASLASAQSVKLFHQGAPLADGDTIPVGTSVGSSVTTYIEYTNVGEEEVYVRVRRENISMNEGDALTFCVGGSCVLNLSQEFVIYPGDTIREEDASSVFHADYTCNSEGSSLIRFIFYNTEDETDAVTFYLRTSTSLGIPQYSSGVAATAYPNPATTTVNIRYVASAGSGSFLVVRNLVGSEVLRRPVRGEGLMQIRTADMAPGIYVYGIEENGRMRSVRKLVVK